MKKYLVTLYIELLGGISGYNFYNTQQFTVDAKTSSEAVRKARRKVGKIGFVVTATAKAIKA